MGKSLPFNEFNFRKLEKRVNIIRTMSRNWKEKYNRLYEKMNSEPDLDVMKSSVAECIRLYMQDKEEGVSTRDVSLYEFWCWLKE